MKFLYLFMLYGLEVDRYLATRSGNKEFLRDTNIRIARIRQKLDTMEINQAWK